MMPASSTLILLPGWGMAPSSLAPLATALRTRLPGWAINCAALPSLTNDALDAWLDELEARLPEHAWLAGWSLGGMLAMALADRRGARCPGVITLGSNLSFVTRHGWGCALPPATLAAFRARWASAPEKTRSRFIGLIARGSAPLAPMIRQLEAHAAPMSVDQALAGLALLERIDLRDMLASSPCPGLHLFAEFDALVPEGACDAIKARLPVNSEAVQMADTGHAFVLERPEACARHMAAFITQRGTGDAHEC
jgi:pimeloyl-[acyl-carrier protein] methyl ester esterase